MEKPPALRASHIMRNIFLCFCGIIVMIVVFAHTRDTKDTKDTKNAATSSTPVQSAPPSGNVTAEQFVIHNPHVNALPESVQREIYIRIMTAERKASNATMNMDDAAGDKLYGQIVDAVERKDKAKYHLNDADIQDIKLNGGTLHWPAKSQEELKDEQEVRLAKAACHEVYLDTARKRQGDLTVEEADQVDSCRAAGLYH